MVNRSAMQEELFFLTAGLSPCKTTPPLPISGNEKADRPATPENTTGAHRPRLATGKRLPRRVRKLLMLPGHALEAARQSIHEFNFAGANKSAKTHALINSNDRIESEGEDQLVPSVVKSKCGPGKAWSCH